MQLSVKPELVIFDVDGLMLNTEFIWKKAWEESGRLNGIDSFGSAFCKAVGITGEDVERMLAAEYPHEPWRIALAQAREIGSRKLLAEVDVMPGGDGAAGCIGKTADSKSCGDNNQPHPDRREAFKAAPVDQL